MPPQTKQIPRPRAKVDDAAVTPALFSLAQLIETEATRGTYLRETLAWALADADALLHQATHVPDSSDACNYAEGLILDHMMKSDAFALLDEAVSVQLNTELINLVSQTAERSIWLGIAIAYRFFNGAAR
jgi:hypothetical protein